MIDGNEPCPGAPTPLPAATLADGIRLHQAGQLNEAAVAYRGLLAQEPRNSDVLHLLGVVCHQQGDSSRAVELISSAIAINGGFAPYHFSLGTVSEGQGNLDGAAQCYQTAVRIDPNATDAWLALGKVLAELGKFAEAAASLDKALALNPDLAVGYHNLAAVKKELGQVKTAIDHYRRALELDPKSQDTYLALGHLLSGEGRVAEAVDVFLAALKIRPDWPEVLNNLGNAAKELGEAALAEECYRQALTIAPELPGVLMNLCNVLKQQGKIPEAISCYRQELALRPNNEKAHYMLATMEPSPIPERAPRSYVRDLFDSYAKGFDRHLQDTLDYQVPQQLAAAVVSVAGAEARFDVLDLGCGTGLCGQALQGAVRSLVGVDLSPAMIAEAGKRGIYDRLECVDVIDFLGVAAEASYDLVVAGDVFIYIGQLTEIFRHVARTLRPGGLFAFSVEAARTEWIELTESGRYAHSISYIRNLAATFGLEELRADLAAIRCNRKQPVEGYLAVFRKP